MFNGRIKSGLRLSSRLKRLSQAVSVPVTNLVINGDLSDGTTGWIANLSTLSASDNTLFVTATGEQRMGNLWGEISAQFPVGRRFYQRAMIRLDSALCTEIRIFNGAASVKIYDNPPADTWIPVSTIQTTTGAALSYNYWYHYYNTTAIATGKVMSVKSVLLIDLTDLEAALGREVTAEEMDGKMNLFPNQWFDGTVYMSF